MSRQSRRHGEKNATRKAALDAANVDLGYLSLLKKSVLNTSPQEMTAAMRQWDEQHGRFLGDAYYEEALQGGIDGQRVMRSMVAQGLRRP